MKLIIYILLIFELSSFSQTFFRTEISKSDFRDVTLMQAVQNLQRKSQDVDKLKEGFNYVFTPKAKKLIENKITLSLTPLPLFQAIKYTAMTLKMEVKFELRTVIFFAPGEKYRNPVLKEKFIKKDPRLLESLKLRCKETQANNTSIGEVLKSIKEQSRLSDKEGKGINILNISGDSSKTLTMSLKSLSAYDAIRYTCIAGNVTMKLDRSAVVLEKRN